MNYFIRKQQIAQWIFITLSMFASLADAADLNAEKMRTSSPVSGAGIAAQPNAIIQSNTVSPVATEAQTKKVITQPALAPGAEQSLNPQPLPPGGGLIKPMSGARIDMAKPRIDSGIKASPGLIQSVTGTRDKTATSVIGPGMVVAPWVPPGQITGATVNVTSTGATIRIEGSGSCALNLIDMHHGGQGPSPIWPRRADAPPSYIGPLPTRIEVEAKVVNRDSVQIVSAGGQEGCAGYASVRLD